MQLNFNNVSLPQEWASYNTQVSNVLEVVPWTLWDTLTFTSASTTSLVYFTATRATKDLGNLTIAAALPAPYSFLARGIRFFVKGQPFAKSATATGNTEVGFFDDVTLLINTGVLEYTIGNKIYFESPLWMITAGGGASGPLSLAGGAATNLEVSYAQNGNADPRAAYTLAKPLCMAPQINFKVVLSWPAGTVTLTAGNPALTIALDGELARPAQ